MDTKTNPDPEPSGAEPVPHRRRVRQALRSARQGWKTAHDAGDFERARAYRRQIDSLDHLSAAADRDQL